MIPSPTKTKDWKEKKQKLVYKIAKEIALCDSIGEGHNYHKIYTREDFNAEEDFAKTTHKRWATGYRAVAEYIFDDLIKPFIRSLLSEQERKMVDDIIKLSDKIEMENEDGTTQWRGFKHLRNALRDKYLSSSKK